MTTEQITSCRDYGVFCKLKRRDLVSYLEAFGIVETDTAGLIKNLPLWRLREETMKVMKRERGKA